MGIAEQLWETSKPIALDCLEHPFVQGIGDGSLSHEKFAYYVGQDAFFLEAFARAYSITAAKTTDWTGFCTFHRLAQGVLEELQLHKGYAAEWQVDLSTVEPGGATRRYTDFLLATAWSQEVGVTTAAMLPCMKLYSFLGHSLAAIASSQHAYTNWIETYSDPGFDELADGLAVLAEQYRTDDRLMESTYRYAMDCELGFFQAAWEI